MQADFEEHTVLHKAGDADLELDSKCCKRFRDPQRGVFITWGLVGVVVLLYELCMVPWFLAWDIRPTGILSVFAVVAAVYWSLDCALSFWRGYYSQGDLISSQYEITKHYLRGWFLVDVVLVSLDWTSLLTFIRSEDEADTAKLVRFVKLGKAFRMLTLLKLLRVRRLREFISSLLSDMGCREEILVIFRIGSLMARLLWLVHVLCCIWFTIGFQEYEVGMASWVSNKSSMQGDTDFLDTAIIYQYLTCLHWALAAVCLNGTEIEASTTVERLYTVFCLLIGLVIGSSLISALSSNMVSFHMMHKENNNQLRLLRQYLRENRIPGPLSLATQKQATERQADTTKLSRAAVTVLDLVSPELQSRLHEEICSRWLKRHPLFFLMHRTDSHFIADVCHRCADAVHCRKGDYLFKPSKKAESSFCMVEGTVSYQAQAPTVREAVDVMPGKWLCEMALWCHWLCLGKAVAEGNSQLIGVNADKFGHAIRKKVHPILKEYGAIFCVCVNNACPPKAENPTDMEVQHTDLGNIVMMMSRKSRIAVSETCMSILNIKLNDSMNQLVTSHLSHRKTAQDLMREVTAGKTFFVVNEQGGVERILCIVLLHLDCWLEDRLRRLYEIGTLDGKGVEVTCRFPGLKRSEGESSEAAFERLLTVVLGLKDTHCIEKDGTPLLQSSTCVSKKYGFTTRYLEKVFCACTTPALQLPTCGSERFAPKASVLSNLQDKSAARFNNIWQQVEEARRLYFVRDASAGEGAGRFFAFLDEKEFEVLSSPEHKTHLHRALADTVLPDPEVPPQPEPLSMEYTI